MILYAESSAILAWLFDEPAKQTIVADLANADLVLSSELTKAECHRSIQRAIDAGRTTPAAAQLTATDFETAMATWVVFPVTSEMYDRAGRPFPGEPIRTLDAIHLACVLEANLQYPDVAVLSLDVRIRRVAAALGFQIRP